MRGYNNNIIQNSKNNFIFTFLFSKALQDKTYLSRLNMLQKIEESHKSFKEWTK